ncbi:hypothetical protein STEG23_021963 [Scotinomys teguina]
MQTPYEDPSISIILFGNKLMLPGADESRCLEKPYFFKNILTTVFFQCKMGQMFNLNAEALKLSEEITVEILQILRLWKFRDQDLHTDQHQGPRHLQYEDDHG